MMGLVPGAALAPPPTPVVARPPEEEEEPPVAITQALSTINERDWSAAIMCRFLEAKDLDSVRYMVRQAVTRNFINERPHPNGSPPLHFMAKYGNYEAVRVLLKAVSD